MSTLTGKRPISVVIFDRTQAGLSDVPIFAQKLKEKVNTPIEGAVKKDYLSPSARAILTTLHPQVSSSLPALDTSLTPEKISTRFESVLRADSSGGQTGEFAQSTETVISSTSVHTLSPHNQPQFAEDPTLRALAISFVTLDEVLVQLETVKPLIPTVTIPIRSHIRLARSHTHGFVEVLVLPPLHSSDFLFRFELARYQTRRWTRSTVHHIVQKSKLLSLELGRVTTSLVVQIQALFKEYKEKYRNVQIPPITFLSVNSFSVRLSAPEVVSSLRNQLSKRVHSTREVARSLWTQAGAFLNEYKNVQLPSIPFPSVSFRVPTSDVIHQLRNQVSMRIQTTREHAHSFSRLFSLPEFNFARLTSKILIAGSLVLMLLTVGPMVALEVQSIAQKISYSLSNLSTHAEETSQSPMETKPTPIPSANPDPEKQFQIVIPKIGVNSKVIANVDAGDEKAYTEALKKGVAHAAGTGLPGEENTQNKTVFIFGHSTNGEWNISRYNALFYALKDVGVGDTFSIWFWGKEFHYSVKETKIVSADDVSFLLPQTTKDQVILQTCWPPGTSWKRFLVIAEPTP